MTRWSSLMVISGLIVLVLFPRVWDLDAFRSPDEDRWIANTSGFTTKLAHGRVAELVQQPHPGITTQWLGSLAVRYDDWAVKKLPLVLGQSLLILVVGYVLRRLWGRMAGVFTVLTLASNPLLYAHTRVYAMDSLLALFSLLALGFLLLWHQQRTTGTAGRYLVASAFCTAAAILSKLSGIALLPIIAVTLICWGWQERKTLPTGVHLRTVSIWILAFILSLALILPSFAVAPQSVIGDFLEFFRSDDYQELHQLGPRYYLRTLIFFSTPIQWLGLILLVWLAAKRQIKRASLEQLIIVLGFAILLIIQMTLGAKKGDRYILPSVAILDIVTGFTMARIYTLAKPLLLTRQRSFLLATFFLFLLALVQQFSIIWQTHPHTLAYVNPITKPWFGERRHGWGEGLDLAAAYLNNKPDANELKVAAYYPQEFAPYFKGETVAVHQHDSSSSNYVIIYRGMFERGPDAWETDVVNSYRHHTPEKVISIGSVPMVWIYRIDSVDE